MARIAGIDLPKNKRGEIGLTYIFGIGKSRAQYILDKTSLLTSDIFPRLSIAKLNNAF